MTIMFSAVIDHVTCSVCGIIFGLSSSYRNQRVSDGVSFYCPNGHLQYFPGETHQQETDRLGRELKATRRSHDEARDEVKKKNAELRRVKRRAAAGVCPCCKRTFVQVARHIAQKHPDFAADQNVRVEPERHKKGERPAKKRA